MTKKLSFPDAADAGLVCGSYEGWRFLAADWALGTILTVCSGAMTAAKLVLADLLENVACRFPSMRL